MHYLVYFATLASMLYASPAWWGFTSARDKDRLEKLIGRLRRGSFLPDDVLSFADLAEQAEVRSLVSSPCHVLSRHLPAITTTNYNLRPREVSPSQKRILVILSLGCFLKGFIVRDFLVWDWPGFLTYLRFVYIFPNSLYSKF